MSETSKAAIMCEVAGNLTHLDVDDLRTLNDFVLKIGKRRDDTIVGVYAGRATVDTRVVIRTGDGSTWLGRTVPNTTGMTIIEPKTKISFKGSWRSPLARVQEKTVPGALKRARAGFASLRNEIVNKSLSLTKAAARMGLTPEGLSNRVDRGEIIAFPDKNRKMIPVELIDDEQPSRTVPGLSAVIAAARMEPFRLVVWLLSPSRALGARRPVDELRAGHIEQVVRAAQSLGVT
jgi:hypothetical protein